MSITVFRLLIIGSFTSAIIGTGLSFMLESSLPAELLAYIKAADDSDMSTRDLLVLLLLLIPFAFTAVWASVELYRFKKHGRTVSLWLTIISPLFCPLLGISIVTGWELLFMELSSMLWVVAMSAAYLSPLMEMFESLPKTS